MSDVMIAALNRLVIGDDLPADDMRAVVSEMMSGNLSAVHIAAFLTALRVKGEAVSEIVGAARAMRDHAATIPATRTGLLDTCGTGGDSLHTFNISTAAALVAAAAGVPVAKHGNRSVSSSSGSADVLEALGINVNLSPEQVARCIETVGIGFCFAPLLHGAMRFASPVRKELGFRTIFNLLGPLTNPANAEYQLIGANRTSAAAKLAEAMVQLGRRRAIVVCGADELDEVSLWGETAVFVVAGDEVEPQTWTHKTFGLPACRVDELIVNSAQESASVLRDVFAGKSGPARNMVLANSAAALLAAERADDALAAMAIAASAIDSGKVAEVCRRLAESSNM